MWVMLGATKAGDPENRTYLVETLSGLLHQNRKDVQLVPKLPPQCEEPLEQEEH